jgi:hypothetical protein
MHAMSTVNGSVVRQASEGGKFNEETFIAALRARAGDRAVRGFDRLLCWSRGEFEWVSWGTGRKTPTFLAGLNSWPDGSFLNFLAVWPTGLVYIELRFLRNFRPFDRAEPRERLRERVARIPGLQLSSAAWRPSFGVAALTDDRAWAEFKALVESALRELLAARDSRSQPVQTAT